MQQKIIIFGVECVGKTRMVWNWVNESNPSYTGEPTREDPDHPNHHEYRPTLGVEVYSIGEQNSKYAIWDCAGDERYGGLRDGYWVKANGVICITDLDRKESISRSKKMIASFKKINPNAHICNILLTKDGEYQENTIDNNGRFHINTLGISKTLLHEEFHSK